MTKRILVFPCGSEIGLEIHRSMRFSSHFDLVGGSSVDDHGRFVFEEHLGGLPFHDAADFEERIIATVRDHRIDAIYPTMDAVAETLQNLAGKIGCPVIGSDPRATAICASKSAMHDALGGLVPMPQRYASLDEIPRYPIFIKPDRGYSARNSLLATTPDEARAFLSSRPSDHMLLLENLPGREWTVDCFSDRYGALRFHAARDRHRISNGISVHTSPSGDYAAEFDAWAHTINATLRPRGAWFFQAKLSAAGQPVMMEVAARLGGSSSLFRGLGINFALLSAFDAFDQDVSIAPNAYRIELDRALDNRYKIDIGYGHVFVDLDDCVLVRGRVNHQLIAFLYSAVAQGKGVTLLTRHHRDPQATLRQHRIGELFDRVIHLANGEKKSDYIDHRDAIFIDDSFAERRNVAEHAGIPVFAPDMVEALLT